MLILDPRKGDIEDDASAPKRRSLLAIAGSLLAEISLTKLVAAWVVLILLPAILLGLAPLVVSGWLAAASSNARALFSGVVPALLLVVVLLAGWFGGRALLRVAERSFWSLNALAVQPGYVLCREALRHLAGKLLPRPFLARRLTLVGAGTALLAGVIVCLVGLAIVALVWPATRWVGEVSDLVSPLRLIVPALANSVVLVAGYFSVIALVWGVADATMPQPQDLAAFDAPPATAPHWRVAHLSDLHTVGSEYGFRIESGRSGPRGNGRLKRVLAELDRIHANEPLDLVLITGDMTDAGSSAEWAEFLDALGPYPDLAARVLVLPGNHDVNVVDRANPARFDLPTSPMKRLRQVRTLAALAALQGDRVRVVDHAAGKLGATLAEVLAPQAGAMVRFADEGARQAAWALGNLWSEVFPMLLPPASADGLGVIVLNSNADSHFSFTNALGMISTEQVRGMEIAVSHYPRAYWIVALHHHVVEYPKPAKALSERIGTALVNGSWFVRELQKLGERAVVMHGHRHVDWIGECGAVKIVSAPSPVMGSTDEHPTSFLIHTLAASADGRHLRLCAPTRVGIPGADCGTRIAGGAT